MSKHDIYEKQSVHLDKLRELRQFVIDICFDYTCKNPRCSADIGLSAIRVLCKGKQSEEEFKKVWEKWKEKVGVAVACFCDERSVCSEPAGKSD